MGTTNGRTWHYRDFYRPAGSPAPEALPLWLVVGNCQAEALRQVLHAVPDRPYRTARIPPVHELTRHDLSYLGDLLGQADVLLSQPIRADYRGLPIGTSQLMARCRASSKTLRWPVIRYAGLYPFHVIVRHPADRSVVPPGVPYHDLRTMVAAADGRGPDDPWELEPAPSGVIAVAEASRAELHRRETRDCDIGVSDVLSRHGVDAAHTINHPGNAVFYDLAARILAGLGVSAAVTPLDVVLLDSVHAPLQTAVLAALGIDGTPRRNWRVEGRSVPVAHIHTRQLSWYQAHPAYLALAAERYARQLDLLGLRLEART